MDRSAAITVARALIEEMGIQPGEIFPEAEATAPASDIDALLPRRRWMPEPEAEYFYCDGFGGVERDKWDDIKGDNDRAEMGNIFPSLEAADEHTANIRAWVELRERSDKVREGWSVVSGDGDILPAVGFSSPHLRSVAVNHIGQGRVDALARWIWNVKD